MIRKAVENDINEIMDIIDKIVVEMNSYGNYQWDKNYPDKNDFLKDIKKGDLFVLERDGCIAGLISINKDEAEEYKELNWSSNDECLVFHRLAVNPNYRKKGIGSDLLSFVDEYALKNNIRYIKADTNSKNLNMQGLVKKNGYTFIGEVNFIGKEAPFYCYDKVIKL